MMREKSSDHAESKKNNLFLKAPGVISPLWNPGIGDLEHQEVMAVNFVSNQAS